MIVSKYNGVSANEEDCIKIKGDYYEKNVDCFKLKDGKWYRLATGNIVEVTDDLKVFKYILTSESRNYIKTFIGYDRKTATPIVKMVNQSLVKYKIQDLRFSRYVLKNDYINILNKELADKYFIYIQNSGNYEFIGDIMTERVSKKKKNDIFDGITDKTPIADKYAAMVGNALTRKIAHSSRYTETEFDFLNSYLHSDELQYNIKFYDSFDDIVQASSEELDKTLNKVDITYVNMLRRYSTTFGIELESSSGKIPIDVLRDSNFAPLRDGSIAGYEYTSKVLQGINGVYSVKTFTEYFRALCRRTENESFHVHIRANSFKLSEKFIESIYTTLRAVEDELFSLFPAFMAETSLYKSSSKNYNNRLPELESSGKPSFIDIYSRYAGLSRTDAKFHFEGFGAMTNPHPDDETEMHKWQIPIRYCGVNLIPLMFSSSGTVEFRLHPPTGDYTKIMYWVLITNAIVVYAHLNKGLVNNLTLEAILRTVYSEEAYTGVVNSIIQYINNRKEFYSQTINAYKNLITEFLESDSHLNKAVINEKYNEIEETLYSIETGKYESSEDTVNAFS